MMPGEGRGKVGEEWWTYVVAFVPKAVQISLDSFFWVGDVDTEGHAREGAEGGVVAFLLGHFGKTMA